MEEYSDDTATKQAILAKMQQTKYPVLPITGRHMGTQFRAFMDKQHSRLRNNQLPWDLCCREWNAMANGTDAFYIVPEYLKARFTIHMKSTNMNESLMKHTPLPRPSVTQLVGPSPLTRVDRPQTTTVSPPRKRPALAPEPNRRARPLPPSRVPTATTANPPAPTPRSLPPSRVLTVTTVNASAPRPHPLPPSHASHMGPIAFNALPHPSPAHFGGWSNSMPMTHSTATPYLPVPFQGGGTMAAPMLTQQIAAPSFIPMPFPTASNPLLMPSVAWPAYTPMGAPTMMHTRPLPADANSVSQGQSRVRHCWTCGKSCPGTTKRSRCPQHPDYVNPADRP